MNEFRYLTGYSDYGVLATGMVKNLRTGNWLGEAGKGYVTLHLTSDEGKIIHMGRHRLVALLFLGPPEAESSVVNHLNGVKGDDRVENLEWTTYQGNTEHAGALKLTQRCLPVSIRNVSSGEVLNFPSVLAASLVMGVTRHTLLWRLRQPAERVYPGGWQLRLREDDRPWAEPSNQTFGRDIAVLVYDLLSGEAFEFPQQSAAAQWLKVSAASMSVWVASRTQRLIKGRYLVKAKTDTTPWQTTVDPLRQSGLTPVTVENAATGERQVFTSAKECAETMGLRTTTLNERLKSNGTKVFKDGFRYARY